MFRHVALFRWKDGTTADQVAEVTATLVALPGLIPELRGYQVGPDAAVSEGNFDYAVVADFDDPAGYQAYATSPHHVAASTEVIRPILAERAAVQYEH